MLLVVLGVGWFLNSLFQPFKGDGEGQVGVVIPQGASLGEIADLLESKGVVSSSSFFQLRARLAGRSDSLKPGRYTLARDMSFTTVLDRLEQGLPPNVVQIAIPEGLSRRRSPRAPRGCAATTSRPAGATPRSTRASTRPRTPRAWRASSFPATYELKRHQPVSKLVSEQLTAFKRNFATVDMRYARSKNLTPYDVLIIASLVEREAQVPRTADRRIGDLQPPPRGDPARHRRHHALRDGQLDEAAARVPARDAHARTTPRVNAGLPPGPIGNPGLASIRAAAHPASTNYLFYVVEPVRSGKHAFAATDAQHQRYVDRYNRARDKRGGSSPTQC